MSNPEITLLLENLKSMEVSDIIEEMFRDELIAICNTRITVYAKCADIFIELKEKTQKGNSRDYLLDFIIKYFI